MNSPSCARVVLWSFLLLACVAALPAQAPVPGPRSYFVKLVCESSDRIVTVRFDGRAASIERTTLTRLLESDISGPHGIVFSPDRRTFFVSIGHGRPYGSAVKYRSADDHFDGQVQLGMFPATLDISPDGNYLYVANFNLHGDMVPSSVSVVDTNIMTEVARVPTCVMPHGSRVSADGAHQYSACMMDDLLVELDAQKMKLARTFRVSKGKEEGFPGLPPMAAHPHMSAAAVLCSPTWAQPSVNGRSVFVACNKSSEIVEIDAAGWKLLRRIPAADGVYNLAVTPDGKLLLATNKRDRSVSILDLASGGELARLPTRRKVVHGVAVSPDSRYAFVTAEGVGSEPGALEIIDLAGRRIVTTLDTPPQAAGIDFWKIE